MSELLSCCPLCGGYALPELYQAKDPHYGIAGRHRLVRCAGCSLVFLNPMYSDDELAALYPCDYYAFQEPRTISPLKVTLKKLLGFWQGTKEPSFAHPGAFLDIGCGAGLVVESMAKLGWDSYGVEMNKAAARVGCARGLRIFSGSLEAAAFPSAFFDYVRASHSLEHIASPGETLNEIQRILKPDGCVLIATPNVRGLTATVFKKYWWHLCPPVHTFNFSVDTLSRFMQRSGFELTNVIFNSDYVGLLGSLQIWLNRNTENRSFEGAIFNNRVLRVICVWVQRVCDIAGYGDMIEISARKGTQRQDITCVEPAHEAFVNLD